MAERTGAGDAFVGIENGAGYGQMLCPSLAVAGHVVLNVPAWRTKRDRGKQGPGKSDLGDAVAIARVVLCDRECLGPALEPELVRALAIVETLRRQTVMRRTDAIQRLRALWTQFDPEAEVAVGNVLAARTIGRLRRVSLVAVCSAMPLTAVFTGSLGRSRDSMPPCVTSTSN